MTSGQRTAPVGFGSLVPATEEVVEVCRRLDSCYQSPRLGNPSAPISSLVYILLSNRTSPKVARRVYRSLRERLGEWKRLLDIDEVTLRNVLRPAGLERKRADNLQVIASTLDEKFGAVTLDPLAEWSTDEAEGFLVDLPGVSTKVAKCVLLYAFDRCVLPVDVHVHRITARLGWQSHSRPDQSHATLETLVPEQHRYAFHVNCVAHGRKMCTARSPACEDCVLSDVCAYARGGTADDQ